MSGNGRRIVAALAVAVLAVALPTGVAGAGERAAAEGDAPILAAESARVPGDRVQWSGAMEPLVPARVLDTRTGNGAPSTKVAKGAVIELQLAGRGGVPAVGAGAVALNVTATGSSSSGYLTVWPTGASRPLASSVNLVGGRTVANTVIAKVGRGGKVSIYNSNGSTHLIADVTGWFPEGGGVEPLVPARILDTRTGSGTPVAPGRTTVLDVTGAGGVPAAGVSAVVLNVTATGTTSEGYLTVWPTGQARPGTSNVNFVRGQTVPNAVIAKVGSNGRISIFNSSGSTHVIVDVAGWFPEAGGIEPIVPARLLDTRSGNGAPVGPLGSAKHLSFRATGRGGVPATGVSAVVLNVTSTRSTAESYLTVWPAGSPRPLASSLNFTRGQNVPNLVVAKVGTGGDVSVFNNAGSTHVLADVVGWFPDGASVPTTLIQPYTDTVIAGSGDVIARTGDSMVGGTVTLSPSADLPATGDPFLAMPGGLAGEGIVGTVSSVVPGAAGTTIVAYAPADIGSVLADFEESYDGPLVPAAARSATAGVAAAAVGSGGGWDFSPFAGIQCTGAVGTQISGLDFDMSGMGAEWDVDLSDRRVRFLLTATPSLTASMQAAGGFNCSSSHSIGSYPIGSLWVEPSLGMDLSGTFTGSLTASAAAPVSIGFEYDDGGTNLSSANLGGSAAFTTDDLGGSVTLTTGVSLAARLFGRVGVEGSFGMALGGQLTPWEQPCVRVDLAPVIGFGVTVDMWLADWDFTIAEFAGDPVTLYEANPSPPCTAEETPVWTGVIHLESVEDGYVHSERSLTVRPKPRPKVGFPGYQVAHVVGEQTTSGPCPDGGSQWWNHAGTYEDPYQMTDPSGVVQTHPGGYFKLRFVDGWPVLDGVLDKFIYNAAVGSGSTCTAGTFDNYAMLQNWNDGMNGLCMQALIDGISAEVLATGERRTLQGSTSVTGSTGHPDVGTCSIEWQLTSLPDPDGDGLPG